MSLLMICASLPYDSASPANLSFECLEIRVDLKILLMMPRIFA